MIGGRFEGLFIIYYDELGRKGFASSPRKFKKQGNVFNDLSGEVFKKERTKIWRLGCPNCDQKNCWKPKNLGPQKGIHSIQFQFNFN